MNETIVISECKKDHNILVDKNYKIVHLKDCGIYSDLSNEDYHGDLESISRSRLMDFINNTPFHYWANYINPDRPKKKVTDEMIFGGAFHTLILEPHLFDKNYRVLPPQVYLKDVGREAYDEYKKTISEIENSGIQILSEDDMTRLYRMKTIFEKNKMAMALIKDARIEHSFFWKDHTSGLMLKARPDILHDNMIVDIKTTKDASPRGFQSAMVGSGNHIQAAMIRDGVEELEGNRIDKAINILIESKYPHAMEIYFIDECALDEGHVKYKQACLDLKNCLETNEWPGYGTQTIGLPKWAT